MSKDAGHNNLVRRLYDYGGCSTSVPDVSLDSTDVLDLVDSPDSLSLSLTTLDRQGLELDALGLKQAKPVDFVLLIRLKVALPEEGLAVLALKGQNMSGYPVEEVAVVADDYG